jgi:Ca2+-binding RTX toxin-like protein
MSLPGVVFGRSEVFGSSSDTEYVDTSGVGSVRVPHGDFLLSADFGRMGPHLSLSEGDTTVVVKNFFTFGKSPDLTTESGHSVIDGSLAVKLAGPFAPGQFAQVGQLAQAPGASSIGTVEKLSGTVTLTRTDGTTVQASKGTSVFSGDIIKTQSDANIGIKFVDDTSFSLGESGRMVIDEMIYDPSNNSGSSSSFNVVKGVFSFVSGQVAKAGDDAMVVTTPVASIGIRGTTVAGKAAAEGSSNSITLLPDADGGVGQIAVSNSAGTQVMSVPFQTTSLTSAFTAPAPPVIVPANQLQNLYGSNITTILPPSPGQQRQEDPDAEPEAASEDGPSGEGEGRGEEGESPDGEALDEEGEAEEGEAEEGEAEEGEAEEGEAEEGEAEEGRANPDSDPRGGENEGPLDRRPREEIEENLQEAEPDELREEIQEAELLEEESREREAEAAGNREEDREIADEAFKQAIEEGADPREAAFRADQAVRENKVDRSFEALEEAVGDGKSLEEALGDEINRTDGSTEDLFLTREGAFRSLDNAFRDPNGDGFSQIVNETVNDDKKDEQVFRDVLLSGGDIGEAFNAAFQSNLAGGSDRIEANLFNLGFDPGQKAQSRIIEQVNEAFIANLISSGTISVFTETIILTTGDDNVSGSPGPGGNTTFIATQGSTLGGNDIVIGGEGVDQLTLLNLSDLIFISSEPNDQNGDRIYSNRAGDVAGKFSSGATLDQINFTTAGGVSETFTFSREIAVDGKGRSWLLVGTSGNDTLSNVGDGTSGADITRGAVSLDIDGNGSGTLKGVSVLMGDGGNDTITSAGVSSVVDGGAGDDIINLEIGSHLVQGGTGDDTIILSTENSMFSAGGRFSGFNSLISGGENSSVALGGGDTLQIGNSSTAANQSFTVEGFDSGGNSVISGMEKLHFFTSGTTFRAGVQLLETFSSITAESGVTDVSLVGTNGKLNFSEIDLPSAVTIISAIAPATDPTFQNGGVRVFDGKDAGGRILVGTSNADTLSGLGGNDSLFGGDGFDTLLGGNGDDTFFITTETNLISGKILSGGSGTDTLRVVGSSITNITSAKLTIETMETFDLSLGADAGVIVSMFSADLEAFSTITGDGTTDLIAPFFGDYTLLSSSTLTNIEAIFLNDPAGGFNNGAQAFVINDGATITGLNAVIGKVSASGAPDDNIEIFGDRDLSGVGLTNIDAVELKGGDGVRQTLGVNFVSTGLAEIKGFETGTGSTSDVIDYKSSLFSGDGTSRLSGTDLTLTTIDGGARNTNVISTNNTGVIEFETSNLSIDLTNSSTSAIVSAVEALLESTDASTNLTGANAGVTQGGANTDSLLIFYENDDDAVIIRYLEGSTSEADYSGELFVLSVFDSLSAESGSNDTFTNANII